MFRNPQQARARRRGRNLGIVVVILVAAAALASLVVLRAGGPMVLAARMACSGRVEVETGPYPKVPGRGGVGTAYRYHCVDGERSRDITDRTATFFVGGLALGMTGIILLVILLAHLRRR